MAAAPPKRLTFPNLTFPRLVTNNLNSNARGDLQWHVQAFVKGSNTVRAYPQAMGSVARAAGQWGNTEEAKKLKFPGTRPKHRPDDSREQLDAFVESFVIGIAKACAAEDMWHGVKTRAGNSPYHQLNFDMLYLYLVRFLADQRNSQIALSLAAHIRRDIDMILRAKFVEAFVERKGTEYVVVLRAAREWPGIPPPWHEPGALLWHVPVPFFENSKPPRRTVKYVNDFAGTGGYTASSDERHGSLWIVNLSTVKDANAMLAEMHKAGGPRDQNLEMERPPTLAYSLDEAETTKMLDRLDGSKISNVATARATLRDLPDDVSEFNVDDMLVDVTKKRGREEVDIDDAIRGGDSGPQHTIDAATIHDDDAIQKMLDSLHPPPKGSDETPHGNKRARQPNDDLAPPPSTQQQTAATFRQFRRIRLPFRK